MMPVAAMLAIAASFWGTHGYVAPAPTWDWGVSRVEHVEQGVQAKAAPGSGHISMSRLWWDEASNRERCQVAIHEDGHAWFSFEHENGKVMAQYFEDAPTPGTCIRGRRAWRRLAEKFSLTS